ncbi:MAG: VanW family protein, partial [Clostridia bacterium]|nr:VanW family protein [Clostridia bacterium]
TVGGGVCQISSTMYIAARDAEFPVTERHSHSHEVPYADSQHDATVSYGGYDFKFQNHLDMPVIIRISTDGETVAAELIQTNNIKSP